MTTHSRKYVFDENDLHVTDHKTNATGSTALAAALGQKHPDIVKRSSSARTAPEPSPRKPPLTPPRRNFFSAHPISELLERPAYWLRQLGRLTNRMIMCPGSTRFEPLHWDKAYQMTTDHLPLIDASEEVAFYTSPVAPATRPLLVPVGDSSSRLNNMPTARSRATNPRHRRLMLVYDDSASGATASLRTVSKSVFRPD